jgi:pyroglutamyl-peptidase
MPDGHQSTGQGAARPRLLVTGFGPFPGAPVNPTEALIDALRADPGPAAGMAEIMLEVLPVEYETVPRRLAAIAESFRPDIAVHFGLSERAPGFTIERLARNEIAAGRPDNAGRLMEASCIVEGGDPLPTTLPAEEIGSALAAAGLPVTFSDDAGGYLCNYIFYLSCDRRCGAFAPDVAGFVHVPPLKPDAPDNPHAMTLDEMARGARLILPLCVERWRTLQ